MKRCAYVQLDSALRAALFQQDDGAIDRSKIDEVAGRYKDGRQDRLDGLTVQYDDWWFNVRPSNTEPLLRLNVEARSKELLEEKTSEVLSLIREE